MSSPPSRVRRLLRCSVLLAVALLCIAALAGAAVAKNDKPKPAGKGGAPTVVASPGAAGYIEQETPAVVDAGVTVTANGNADLRGATVAITAGRRVGDTLQVSPATGITATYDATAGVLTLTGTAPASSYEPALRSVTFSNPTDDPGSARTLTFSATASAGAAAPATRALAITTVNDAPVAITHELFPAAYTEGDPGVPVVPALTVTDPDSPQLAGARVVISAGGQPGEDVLAFRGGDPAISGSYDQSTGVLTLSGAASPAAYEAALRSVTYRNTSVDPRTARRTISVVVDDGSALGNLSAPALRDLTVTAVDHRPEVTTSAGTATFVEDGGPVAVDPGIAVADADNSRLTAASVAITAGHDSSDVLALPDMPGLSATWDSDAGVLALSGSGTPAEYEAALRAVTFSSPGDDPSNASRTVRFTVDEGGSDGVSTPANRAVEVQAVDDPPVLTGDGGTLTYRENDPATPIDTSLDITDADGSTLTGATARIRTGLAGAQDVLSFTDQNGITGSFEAATGTLILSGAATLAEYRTALRSIAYRNTSDAPSTAERTVAFAVEGGADEVTRKLAVVAANDAPAVTTGSGGTFTEDGSPLAVDASLTVADADSAQLAGATVAITGGRQSGDELVFNDRDGITGSYVDGTLTLTGAATIPQYQAALRVVAFRTAGDDPSDAAREVTIVIDDGSVADNRSAPATVTVSVAPVNDSPVLETTDGATAFTENGSAVVVDDGLTVSDADDASLAGATVRIAGVQAGEVLEADPIPGIARAYDADTGTLALSGSATVAAYQAALTSVTYRSTDDDPAAARTIRFQVDDGHATDGSSVVATKAIDVTPVDDTPTVTTSAGAASFTENGPAAVADPALELADPDSATLAGATVAITEGRVSGDSLVVTDTAAITASYDADTGVLTLTGTDTVAAYQELLRTVAFDSTSDTPGASRTIAFRVDDGAETAGVSAAATRDVAVIEVNDTPVVTLSEGATTYVENGDAKAVDPALTVTDADSDHLARARASIATGQQADDELLFDDHGGITGAFDAESGVLTLSGSATSEAYEAALRSIRFRSSSDRPATEKTIAFRVDDGHPVGNLSEIATKALAVTPVNDAPTAVDASAATDEDTDLTLPREMTGRDPDGDALTFTPETDTAHGTVTSFDAATGDLTYRPDPDFHGTDTIAYTASDGHDATASAAITVTVRSVDDPPALAGGAVEGALSYTEDDPAAPVHDGLIVADADGAIAGATIQISDGYIPSEDVLAAPATDGMTRTFDAESGTLTITGPATPAAFESALRSVTYRNTSETPSTAPRTVTFTISDPEGSTATLSRGITVASAPDAPILTSGGTLAYTENDPATAIDPSATVEEVEGDLLTGASVEITAGATAGQDALEWTDTDLGDNIARDVLASTDQRIVLVGVASAAAYQAALRGVTYANTTDNPTAAPRTVEFAATDATGLTGSATRTVTVAPTPDPPVANDDRATLTEDAAATPIAVLDNDIDLEGDPITIVSATKPAHGTAQLTGPAGGATGLTYRPDANACGSDTFTYTVNGGDTATVTMTIECVNDAPVADDETFSGSNGGVGNTTLVLNSPASPPSGPKKSITGSLLAGDTDAEGSSLTITGAGVDGRDGRTMGGGTVSIEPDGDFVYQPAAGTSCTATSDRFDYTVSDGADSDRGTVTIALAGCVWYVRNDAPAGGGGTSAAPFDTLAEAEAASVAGQTVFVLKGDGTSAGLSGDGYVMTTGERLIGERTGLTIDPDGTGPRGTETLAAPVAGAYPVLTASNAYVVTMDAAGELRGVELDPEGAGGGVRTPSGAGAIAGGTIADVRVIDHGTPGTQPGVRINRAPFNSTTRWDLTGLTVDVKATGVELSGSARVLLSSPSITTDGGPGLSVDHAELVADPVGPPSRVDAMTVRNAQYGVYLNFGTGTLALGDGVGTDLDLRQVRTGIFAFAPPKLSVDDRGSDVIQAAGGPAIDYTRNGCVACFGTSMFFDEVSSSGSSGDGVRLDNYAGDLVAHAGTIGGYAGTGLNFTNGSGTSTFTYEGALDDAPGANAIRLNDWTGDVRVSGPIRDSADSGGGARVTSASSTPSKLLLTGPVKQFNTGSADGISVSGAIQKLDVTGGGLDIDTTSGRGVAVNDGNTVKVTGPGNSVKTTTGRAVEITDTDIAEGLTFRDVSSDGAPNGILLQNTGTTAGMTITGDGTDDSGGTILGATGDAVSLRSTAGFSADELRIAGSNGTGVRGAGVTGFTLTDSTVDGAGAAGAPPESAIAFDGVTDSADRNLTGTVTVDRNTLTDYSGNGIGIRNEDGTIDDLLVRDNTLRSGRATGDAIHIDAADGFLPPVSTVLGPVTPHVNARVSDAALTGNRIAGHPHGSGIWFRGISTSASGDPAVAQGTAVDPIEISGNAINPEGAATPLGGDGISVVLHGESGAFDVARNGTEAQPLRGIAGRGISLGIEGNAPARIAVEDNHLAQDNRSTGAGEESIALAAATSFGAPAMARISGNVTTGYAGAGIGVKATGGTDRLDVKVLDNSVGAPDAAASRAPIELTQERDGAGQTICATVSGNTTTAAPSPDARPGITLLAHEGVWFGPPGTPPASGIAVTGLVPSPASPSATEAFVTGLNPGASLGAGAFAGKRVAVLDSLEKVACTHPGGMP